MTRSAVVLLAATAALVVPALVVAAHPPAVLILGGELLLDPTSRLFFGLIQLVFAGVALHVAASADASDPLPARLAGFGLPFLVACDVAITAESPVLSWAALELSTLVAAPLLVRPGERPWGSLQYFLFSSVGLGLVLLGFAAIERGLGDRAFVWDALVAAPPAASPWLRVGVALALAGYGTKLGLFPLNTWVPSAYAAAPAPITALLGAVQFNAALVGLLRVVEVFHSPLGDLVPTFLLASGLATMAVSTLGIVATRDYVRLLGYASVNHAGVIAFGLGLGAPAAYGVLLYAASNTFVKAILFLAAGRVRARFATTDAREVRGLVKLLPYNGVLLMVGTFALLGLPPFGSFLGELLVASSVVQSGRAALLLPFSGLLVISFVATGRTLFPMIWGEPGDGGGPDGGERLGFAAPKLGFLLALVALGLYVPPGVNALLRDVAATLGAP